MSTPRRFSQTSAGSRTSSTSRCNFPSMGSTLGGREVYPFSLLIYLVLEVLEVLEPLVSTGFSLGEI